MQQQDVVSGNTSSSFVWRGRGWGIVIGVALSATVAAIALDTWYQRVLIERERERVVVLTLPYAKSLEGYFDRRISRLQALRAFVEAQPDAASLRADFPAYAEGLGSAASGIRGLQLVRDARIGATWPESDAPALTGFDLRSHKDRRVPRDYDRAMRTGRVVITGPVALIQGGQGFVVRQRVERRRPDMPDMVVAVLDLGSLLSEAEFATLPGSLRFGLLDRNGALLNGSANLDDPTQTIVDIGDGSWTLLMAPANGWAAAVSDDLRPLRVASVLVGLMLVLMVASVSGRQRVLESAVEERTSDLARANEELRREVAERLALEEQLLHSQKMEAVGTLAGGVAHDFNNLLTAILGFTQLAEQQVTDAATEVPDTDVQKRLQEVRDDLTEILKAADRASLLTSQLLAFSRRQKVTPTAVDANAVVNDLERMLQRLIGETVSLVTETAADALPVLADSGQFAQVILNLVVNARDALSGGGMIRVTTRPLDLTAPTDGVFAGLAVGRWVVISVEDNGCGMSPEVQARMFEPFFTTKSLGHGTGLGLSTVYGIVTQAGGQLFVDSRPAKGTTVTVVWPRSASELTPRRDARPLQEHSGELILVVEDEPGLRRLVAEILRRRGHEVRVAEQGTDALAQIDAGLVPSLVITDVVMPGMGGRELAAVLATRHPDLPILFMSGYQAGEAVPEDASHGFLAKPFTPDDLVRAVREALSAR
jgi:signal transduction histidine kinase/CheY-like chemotaxis protein